MTGKQPSEAREHGVLHTEKPPRQARAIIHVENNFHGPTKYRALPKDYNPAAGRQRGRTREKHDFEIAFWIRSRT